MGNDREPKGYTTIHIPTALAKFIDKLIDSEEFAFTSRSEFVKDAIRRSLERHGFYPGSSSLFERSLHGEELQALLNRQITNLRNIRSSMSQEERDTDSQ